MCRSWSSPSGAWAVRSATSSSQASARRVGWWRTAATGAGATPATRPAVRPHTITSPATGTHRRLAGSDATGTGPKVASSTGATPSCAASVTPAASRSGTRAGKHRREPRRQDHDGDRRADRQLEAGRAHQQRIDQHQRGDRDPDDPKPRDRLARHRERRRQRRHRRRPQHRWLEARHQPEEADDPERGEEAWPEAEAAEQRPGQRQGERHVLARDGQQVGETGAAERVGQIGRLLPIVTDDEAGVERPGARPERRRSGDQRAAQPVGQPAGGVAAAPPVDPQHGELTRDVTGHEPGLVGISRSHRAPHADHLAGEAGTERVGGDPASARLEPPVAPSHVHPNTVEVRRRIAQQRHLPRHDPRLEAVETLERPLGEPAGEERDRHPTHDRPPEHRGDRGDHQPDHQGLPHRHERPGDRAAAMARDRPLAVTR